MLKRCFKMFKGWIMLYVFLGIAMQLLNSLGIVYFQKIIDKVTTRGSLNIVLNITILYGIILGISCVVNYLAEYPSVYLSNSITEKLKIMALEKISKIDYQAYQDIGTGEMIKVIENGASAGSDIIFSFFLKILHELLPTVFFSLIFIGFYNVKIMYAVALGYIIVFFITNILLKVLYSIKSSLLKDQEKMSKYSVRGFMELVVFRTNKRYFKEINKLNGIANNIIIKNSRIRMVHESFFALFAFLIVLIKTVVIFYGIKSIYNGETSIGIIVALIAFIDKIYTPIAIFNVLYVNYKLNRLTFKRFEDFINAPEDKNLDDGKHMDNVLGSIDFKNVSFNYETTKILKNISLSIDRGTTVAFVGSSGGGKSTLIKLIIGLLKKHNGEILVDNIDIDELALNSYYDHISYISQDAPVFDSSIRQNIIFDNDISDERIYEILEKVHLKEKVLSLPDKLDTMIGEKGLKLSGGERQRLAFARVIAQNRSVVVLDEPVSALDNITEKSIMESIIKQFKDKTLIIVAHRLQFIKNVDKIFVMKNGQVIDEGNFNYLIEKCDYFKVLWNKKDSDLSKDDLEVEMLS